MFTRPKLAKSFSDEFCVFNTRPLPASSLAEFGILQWLLERTISSLKFQNIWSCLMCYMCCFSLLRFNFNHWESLIYVILVKLRLLLKLLRESQTPKNFIKRCSMFTPNPCGKSQCWAEEFYEIKFQAGSLILLSLCFIFPAGEKVISFSVSSRSVSIRWI